MKNLFLTSLELHNAKAFISSLSGYCVAKFGSYMEQVAIDGEKVHILTNHGEIFTIDRKVLNEEDGITPSDVAYGIYVSKRKRA